MAINKSPESQAIISRARVFSLIDLVTVRPSNAMTISDGMYHEHYPHLWQSECGTYRIIRCCDDIQYIFQRWREPKWRSLSYHVEYDSLVRRWGSIV